MLPVLEGLPSVLQVRIELACSHPIGPGGPSSLSLVITPAGTRQEVSWEVPFTSYKAYRAQRWWRLGSTQHWTLGPCKGFSKVQAVFESLLLGPCKGLSKVNQKRLPLGP